MFKGAHFDGVLVAFCCMHCLIVSLWTERGHPDVGMYMQVLPVWIEYLYSQSQHLRVWMSAVPHRRNLQWSVAGWFGPGLNMGAGLVLWGVPTHKLPARIRTRQPS
jgi:hypothetical protein